MAQVLVDASCAFCMRWVAWAKRRGAQQAFVDCRDLGPGLGLSAEDCARSAWWIGERRLEGGRAVCAVWQRLPGTRNMGWRLLGHVADLPVLRLVTRAVYRIVARSR